MNILNLGSLDELKDAIAREDVKYLTSVQGMGQKTAERLVVELKAKVSSLDNKIKSKASQALIDVIDGLTSMGYGKEEVKLVIRELKTEGRNTEEILREALKKLSK